MAEKPRLDRVFTETDLARLLHRFAPGLYDPAEIELHIVNARPFNWPDIAMDERMPLLVQSLADAGLRLPLSDAEYQTIMTDAARDIVAAGVLRASDSIHASHMIVTYDLPYSDELNIRAMQSGLFLPATGKTDDIAHVNFLLLQQVIAKLLGEENSRLSSDRAMLTVYREQAKSYELAEEIFEALKGAPIARRVRDCQELAALNNGEPAPHYVGLQSSSANMALRSLKLAMLYPAVWQRTPQTFRNAFYLSELSQINGLPLDRIDLQELRTMGEGGIAATITAYLDKTLDKHTLDLAQDFIKIRQGTFIDVHTGEPMAVLQNLGKPDFIAATLFKFIVYGGDAVPQADMTLRRFFAHDYIPQDIAALNRFMVDDTLALFFAENMMRALLRQAPEICAKSELCQKAGVRVDILDALAVLAGEPPVDTAPAKHVYGPLRPHDMPPAGPQRHAILN